MIDNEQVIDAQKDGSGDAPPRHEAPESAGPPSFSEGSFREAKKKWIDYFERNYVRVLLEKHKGRLGRAARSAGMDRKTLYRLIRKHTGEEPEE